MGTRLLAGAVGGLVAGLSFGLLMLAIDMLEMVGALIPAAVGDATQFADWETVAGGWAVHLAIALVLGLIYALTFGRARQAWLASSVFGLVYGVVWWVLGGLLAMPAMLGMPVLAIGTDAVWSLYGHITYGLILALLYTGIVRSRERLVVPTREPTVEERPEAVPTQAESVDAQEDAEEAEEAGSRTHNRRFAAVRRGH